MVRTSRLVLPHAGARDATALRLATVRDGAGGHGRTLNRLPCLVRKPAFGIAAPQLERKGVKETTKCRCLETPGAPRGPTARTRVLRALLQQSSAPRRPGSATAAAPPAPGLSHVGWRGPVVEQPRASFPGTMAAAGAPEEDEDGPARSPLMLEAMAADRTRAHIRGELARAPVHRRCWGAGCLAAAYGRRPRASRRDTGLLAGAGWPMAPSQLSRPPLWPLLPPLPRCAGYLRKLNRHQHWQKRYFEVVDHFFVYYKRDDSPDLLCAMDLYQADPPRVLPSAPGRDGASREDRPCNSRAGAPGTSACRGSRLLRCLALARAQNHRPTFASTTTGTEHSAPRQGRMRSAGSGLSSLCSGPTRRTPGQRQRRHLQAPRPRPVTRRGKPRRPKARGKTAKPRAAAAPSCEGKCAIECVAHGRTVPEHAHGSAHAPGISPISSRHAPSSAVALLPMAVGAHAWRVQQPQSRVAGLPNTHPLPAAQWQLDWWGSARPGALETAQATVSARPRPPARAWLSPRFGRAGPTQGRTELTSAHAGSPTHPPLGPRADRRKRFNH